MPPRFDPSINAYQADVRISSINHAKVRVLMMMLAEHFDDVKEAEAFLRDFAGTTLQIPPRAEIEKALTDARLVRALERDPSHSNVRRISDLLDVRRRSAADTFNRSGRNLQHHRQAMAARTPCFYAPPATIAAARRRAAVTARGSSRAPVRFRPAWSR